MMQVAADFTLARRMNPRREHLIVSRRLAKHLPTPGATAAQDGRLLAARISRMSTGNVHVIGLSETATGLGLMVSRSLRAHSYTATSRRDLGTECEFVNFREEHSHAPGHALCSRFTDQVTAGDTLLIVDDEVTTGSTVGNLIARLLPLLPDDVQILVACLLDSREQQGKLAPSNSDGTTLEITSLSRAMTRPEAFPNLLKAPVAVRASNRGVVSALPIVTCPDQFHGLSSADMRGIEDTALALAESLSMIDPARCLVLGSEDFMGLPILVAEQLSAHVQSTTRSPIFVSEEGRYPIRAGWTFPSCTDPSQAGFLYNANHERPDWSEVLLFCPWATAATPISPRLAGCIQTLRHLFKRVWLQPVLEQPSSRCAA